MGAATSDGTAAWKPDLAGKPEFARKGTGKVDKG